MSNSTKFAVIATACTVVLLLTTDPGKSESKNKNVYMPTQADIQAAEIARRLGYRCDKLSSGHAYALGNEYRITCNDFRYSYIVKDVGGRYVVFID